MPRIQTRIFVVGCFRSGTTLLENLIRQHPEVVGSGFETSLFTDIVHGWELAAFNRDRWAPLLEQYCGETSWGAVSEDPVAVFEAIHESMASREDASAWVEKTPLHLFHVERILRQIPASKVVWVLRDGRDVATSMASVPYVLPGVRGYRKRVIAAAVLWEWMAIEGLRLLDSYPDRVMQVRYENLVTNPDLALRELGRFLQLPANDQQLRDWLDRSASIESNSSFGQFSGLSTVGIGRWRDRSKISARDAEDLEALLARSLRELGYPIHDAEGLPAARLSSRFLWGLFLLARISRFRKSTGAWLPAHLKPYFRWLMKRGGRLRTS